MSSNTDELTPETYNDAVYQAAERFNQIRADSDLPNYEDASLRWLEVHCDDHQWVNDPDTRYLLLHLADNSEAIEETEYRGRSWDNTAEFAAFAAFRADIKQRARQLRAQDSPGE